VDLSTEGMLIIHTLAYALRHNPAQFNLDLDAEGYLSVDSTSSVDAVRPTVAVAGHETPAGAVTTCHCDR
jgi:RNA:NAD 2'-phosphotransferase (TPT1/KptA family)